MHSYGKSCAPPHMSKRKLEKMPLHSNDIETLLYLMIKLEKKMPLHSNDIETLLYLLKKKMPLHSIDIETLLYLMIKLEKNALA